MRSGDTGLGGVRYCTRCVYPSNHPLGITFDEQGVCSGCRVHEEKDVLQWEERAERLRAILTHYRDRSGRNFDCVIPVCGARDSYFIVHSIKKIYGMNPLLVGYNKEYNTKIGIRNLAYLRTIFDCDYVSLSPAPALLKKIVRHSLRKLGSIYWHCLAGATAFPVQVAVRFRIPLIVWGAHQGIDQVGMFSHLDEVEMTRKYRKEHDLMGVDAEDMVDEEAGIDEQAIEPFVYPSDEDLEKVGIRGIYLNNYIRWDSKSQHERMIEHYGYETAVQQRTFNTYEDVDCFHYSGLHDYIKFLKYGYGKVSDHASREIRLRRMTREEGIEMVRRYQGRFPQDLALFLEWAGLTERELFDCVEAKRDQRIWERDNDGRWHLKDSIVNHANDPGVEEVRLEKIQGCEYIVTPSREPEAVEDRYVVVARGYVDKIAA